jgi:hypothetical protein
MTQHPTVTSQTPPEREGTPTSRSSTFTRIMDRDGKPVFACPDC